MQFQNNQDKVLIIDFGSQVTKLIARRIRDLRSLFRDSDTKRSY